MWRLLKRPRQKLVFKAFAFLLSGYGSQFWWRRTQWAGVISKIQAVGHILPACRFSHVRREANQVAHELAQRGLSHQQAVVMRLKVPPDLQALVRREALIGGVNRSHACNQNPS
jgi:hypothetical protein